VIPGPNHAGLLSRNCSAPAAEAACMLWMSNLPSLYDAAAGVEEGVCAVRCCGRSSNSNSSRLTARCAIPLLLQGAGHAERVTTAIITRLLRLTERLRSCTVTFE
jgi:hypothetical protein